MVAVDGDALVVEVDTAVTCARCASGKGCGAGLLGSGRLPRLRVPLAGQRPMRVGAPITLELAPGRLWTAAALAYGAPLVGMFAGALLATVLTDRWTATGSGEWPVIGMAIAGIVAGIVWGRSHLRAHHCRRDFVPRVRRDVSLRLPRDAG